MVKIKKLLIKDNAKKLVDISFEIKKTTALVGESGSGKSLTLKAILDMLPSNLYKEFEISAPFIIERGKTISFVPQNPFTALSPLTKIKDQIFANLNEVKALFEKLNLDISLLNSYPPNLSGGQLQRVIFAIALINSPKLLLLDEPTTALDANLRHEVVNLLKTLQKEFDFYMVFVTHDINLASNLCEHTVVLKKGEVAEEGETKNILKNPKSAYTKILIESNFKNREFRK
jgi:peptide/nickel transport system ATP-binding protein